MITEAMTVEQFLDSGENPGSFIGEPDIHPPFGVILLPSFFLDEMDAVWLEWLRDNRDKAITVNLAFLSKRLRDADALPINTAWLDHPKLYTKNLVKFEDVYDCFHRHREEGYFIWGGYDFWFLDEIVRQRKFHMKDGQKLPLWNGPNDIRPKGSDPWYFAGQYTSCMAANVLAHLLGWKCTIFIVGNIGGGPYCEIGMETTKRYDAHFTVDKKRACADRTQWWYLREKARETETEIIHVGGSTDTVPRMTEKEVLEVLHGVN